MKGIQIDKSLQELRLQLAPIERERKRLARVGCELAYVHIKKSTRKMYLREPASEDRACTYIGVDEEKQLEAMARIERYNVREQLAGLSSQVESELEDFQYRLKELCEEIQRALADAKNQQRSILASAASRDQLKARLRTALKEAIAKNSQGTRAERGQHLAG